MKPTLGSGVESLVEIFIDTGAFPMAQSTPSGLDRGPGDYCREDLSEKGAALGSRAGDQVERVTQDVGSAARSVAEQGRQAKDQVQVVADNFRTAVEKSIKEQPLATLALAAGAGFIMGALWKS